MQGSPIKRFTVGQFDDFSQIHDGHAIADVFNHTQVVGYEQVGQVELFLQILKKIDDLRLDGNVES